MWLWCLAPGERYPSEAGSENWHEMLFVAEGILTVELPGAVHRRAAGEFLIFSSEAAYAFANRTEEIVRCVRNVVL